MHNTWTDFSRREGGTFCVVMSCSSIFFSLSNNTANRQVATNGCWGGTWMNLSTHNEGLREVLVYIHVLVPPWKPYRSKALTRVDALRSCNWEIRAQLACKHEGSKVLPKGAAQGQYCCLSVSTLARVLDVRPPYHSRQYNLIFIHAWNKNSCGMLHVSTSNVMTILYTTTTR